MILDSVLKPTGSHWVIVNGIRHNKIFPLKRALWTGRDQGGCETSAGEEMG